MKLRLLSLFLSALFIANAFGYVEPPFLAIKNVKVNPGMSVILKSETGEHLLLNERTRFSFKPDIQLKNAKDKKGQVTFLINGKNFIFRTAEKIELDDYRLPFWLRHIIAMPQVTGQKAGLEIILAEEGDKRIERFDESSSCSETRFRKVCRQEMINGRWVTKCREEAHTFYGTRIDRRERTQGIDGYQARLVDTTGLEIATFDFDVKKDQNLIVYRGRCEIGYIGPDWH